MNIIKKLFLLLKLKKMYINTLKEAKREVVMETNGNGVKTVKPAYRTTEFYLVLVSNLVAIVGTLKGVIPADTGAIIIAALNGIYGVLRTIAKK